jgi:hypothetical protein
MRFPKLLLAVAAALVALPALADPTEGQRAAAKEAEVRGAEIYAYDQAAWHSTDRFVIDLQKHGLTLETAQDAGFGGYVVEPAGGGLLMVTYYAKNEGKWVAMARYWVQGSRVKKGGFLKPKDDSTLSPLALKLIDVREKVIDTAVEQKVFLCTKGNLNTVVLPPRADGTIPAYVMSSGVETGVFPAGGHYRYVFGTDGKLLSSRAFTKACVNVDVKAVPRNAAGYAVSHMLDPQPTEIHVFVSYNTPVKLFVIIEGSKDLWEVSKGKVTFKQVLKDYPDS